MSILKKAVCAAAVSLSLAGAAGAQQTTGGGTRTLAPTLTGGQIAGILAGVLALGAIAGGGSSNNTN